MEELVLFTICTPYISSHKWEVNEEGLIDYYGDLIEPSEALERFLEKYTMFKVIRADISRRVNVPRFGRPYSWIELKRLV